MFDCKEELSVEQLDKIKSIIKTDVFQNINSIIYICDLNQDEDKIIKNIKDYIWIYLSNRNEKEFSNKVDSFISFINNYPNIRKPSFILPSNDGKIMDLDSDYLVLCNGHHIYNDFRYLKPGNVNGLYMQESYLGSDHKVYLSKRSMRSKSLEVSNETAKEVDYNSLLAESVFNYLGQPTASYYLMRTSRSPFNSIFTPNFLSDNQELIHLEDMDIIDENNLDTHTNRLNRIIKTITNRYRKDMNDTDYQQLINKISLQFCIQSFIKLLIGPMDDNLGNTAIVLTHNGSIPSIDIAPAYDLDISFNVANELASGDRMHQILDFNGNPSTITSLINEFKDIPGFKEFLDSFVNKLISRNVSKEIMDDVYKRTNLSFFKDREDRYTLFLNNRFLEVLNTYRSIYLMEAINEINMGR